MNSDKLAKFVLMGTVTGLIVFVLGSIIVTGGILYFFSLIAVFAAFIFSSICYPNSYRTYG